MTATERFLRYITYDTRSDEASDTRPSTDKQRLLGQVLAEELAALGLENAHLDPDGAVYAHLPATTGREGDPVIALIAHMDTSPSASGANVRARRVLCTGEDLVLNAEKGIVMEAAVFPDLQENAGEELIVTDGTTLLGADDKAGVAEIMAAAEHLVRHPDLPHGRAAICFTPDEEIGRGASYVDLDKLGADFGYTVDGGPLGSLEYENFNAASAEITVRGVNIHPGEGKNKMKNAALIAARFISLVPPAESPAHTEGYEGFYHLCEMRGDENEARLSWIIRDHSREKFEARKARMEAIAAYLNGAYGPGTVTAEIKDSYYNMLEKVADHPDVIHRARAAYRSVPGVTVKEVPIRGGTDGAQLSWRGLPCPNLSTGGYHFHGVFEYIPTRSLEAMTRVLVSLLTLPWGTAEDPDRGPIPSDKVF